MFDYYTERTDNKFKQRTDFGSSRKLILKGDLHENVLVVKPMASFLLPNF